MLIFAKIIQIKMFKLFKIIAVLEGISSMLLFFFAMPMKYLMNNKYFMRPVGMGHGVLFIGFILMTLFFALNKKWTSQKVILFFFFSIIPCGTFYIDKKYLKNA
jgi:integral membrane protein